MAGEYVEAPWRIGDVIRKLRREAELSLEQLADRAGIPSYSTIFKLERGLTKEPKRSTLRKIAAVFGLTLRELEDLVPQQPVRFRLNPEPSTEVYLRPVTEKPPERKKRGGEPFHGSHAHDKRKLVLLKPARVGPPDSVHCPSLAD